MSIWFPFDNLDIPIASRKSIEMSPYTAPVFGAGFFEGEAEIHADGTTHDRGWSMDRLRLAGWHGGKRELFELGPDSAWLFDRIELALLQEHNDEIIAALIAAEDVVVRDTNAEHRLSASQMGVSNVALR